MRQREKQAEIKKIEVMNSSVLIAIDVLNTFIELNKQAIKDLSATSKKTKKPTVAKIEKPAKKTKKTVSKRKK